MKSESRSGVRKVFPPKYDRRLLAVILLPPTLVTLFLCLFLLWGIAPKAPQTNPLIASFVLILFLDLLLVFLVFSTRYVLTPQHLILRSGPLQIKFALATIHRVATGQSADLYRGFRRFRLAFSTDCLIIGVNGRLIKEIVISPKDKYDFLGFLSQVSGKTYGV